MSLSPRNNQKLCINIVNFSNDNFLSPQHEKPAARASMNLIHSGIVGNEGFDASITKRQGKLVYCRYKLVMRLFRQPCTSIIK